jgi:glycoside/pentoside/hexuronide:cation symporter, GPH family
LTHPEKLPVHLKIFHGIGSIAYGVKDNGFGTFLMLYYNQVVGLDPLLVSLSLAAAMMIDAFADPLIGHLSDRTYTRWGKRLPWLYIAPIPLAFAWLMLWSPPAGMGGWIFAYLIGAAVAVRLLVSACEVPGAALVPQLTSDYDERTEIVRYRYLFGWSAGLITLYLAYSVFLVPDATHKLGMLNEKGYWSFALFGAVLMAGATILSAIGQHKRVAHLPPERPTKTSIKQAFFEISRSFRHPAAFTLILGAITIYTAQGITFSFANYLYIFVWEFSRFALGLYPALLFSAVICAFFMVRPLTGRFGKKSVVIFASIIAMLFWTTPIALKLAGYWPASGTQLSTQLVFAFAFFSNACGITAMIAGQSMVADLVEAAQMDTGKRTEGIFSAGWFFAQKCGTGLGILITGLAIKLSGLPEKAVPGRLADGVIEGMMLCYIIALALLAGLAAKIFLVIPLDRKGHEERLAALARRSVNPKIA